jgi:hypothetical protein
VSRKIDDRTDFLPIPILEKGSSTLSEIPTEKPTELSLAAKIALEYFGLAKAEITTRIRVRDTLLAAYAAAAFTASAAILGTKQLGEHFLYGLPYLCFAFALLVSYHHAGIGALGKHCAEDLLPTLQKEGQVPGYEHSKVFRSHHSKHNTMRVVAHCLILLLPALIAMVVNFPDILRALKNRALDYYSIAWFAALVLIIMSLSVIIKSNSAHFRGLDLEISSESETKVKEP